MHYPLRILNAGGTSFIGKRIAHPLIDQGSLALEDEGITLAGGKV